MLGLDLSQRPCKAECGPISTEHRFSSHRVPCRMLATAPRNLTGDSRLVRQYLGPKTAFLHLRGTTRTGEEQPGRVLAGDLISDERIVIVSNLDHVMRMVCFIHPSPFLLARQASDF